MVMLASTLATELKKLTPTSLESTVQDRWASAYTKYMAQSAVLGISPVNEAVLASAKAAMYAALAGISTPRGAALPAAQLIVASIKAFWATALAAATTIWVTAPPLVPAPFTLPVALLAPPAELAVAQALAVTFTANMTAGLSLSDACDAIVLVLHPAGAGATVTQATTPSPTPGIPVL